MKADKFEEGQVIFYFDFDNTITSFDVLDDVIARFSPTEEWTVLEKAWQEGRIGSKTCLVGQMACIRATRGQLAGYLSKIAVDPYFKKLLAYLRRKNVGTAIVSDSFTFFIREILKANGVRKIDVCANELEISGNRLMPSFPHGGGDCPDCAHCKKAHVLQSRARGRTVVYVGDGRSDFCAAMEADRVYAKGTLLAHLQREGKSCVAFEDFQSVFEHATSWLARRKAPGRALETV
ncbi:MAG: MtnX-like HAD-IB family phosphatase [Candidatus Omnitrophota bacterium]|jgi:2,3-diketo-5-methylthio-1-phosphopentane phosphatase